MRLFFCMRGVRGNTVEYVALEKTPWFSECDALVRSLGYALVELNVFKRSGKWQVRVVIAGPDAVGIDDCASVHRALQARLEVLLDSRDMYMEVTSPGVERVLKHAGEFKVFSGRAVRLWHVPQAAWVEGVVVSSDEKAVVLACGGENKEYSYSEIAKARLSEFSGTK